MKLRLGFVTNSSSTAFIIASAHPFERGEIKTIEDLVINRYGVKYIAKYGTDDVDEDYINEIWSDVKAYIDAGQHVTVVDIEHCAIDTFVEFLEKLGIECRAILD